MNAAEQAKGLELASKIATIVNLFKLEFPDARADLKPWRNDPDTRELIDPRSIDIGFHFPGWSPRLQCRSILLQIRFHGEGEDNDRLIGLELQGFNHEGTAWRLTTIDNWCSSGDYLPRADVEEKLKNFGRQVFGVFNRK